MTTVTAAPHAHGRGYWFVRHLLEMTGAMLVGMMLYATLVGVVVGIAGSTYEDARVGHPELFALGMATGMTVPMVAWMRRRGHGWRNSFEMAAAMFVPAFVFIGCYWLGAVEAAAVCPLACVTMIPAMAAAMLFRLEDYTHGGAASD